MRLMYNLLFPLALALWLPRALWKRWREGKYQKSLPYRFGKGLNSLEKKASKLIWVHAVSVGEVRAVAPFAKKLLAAYQKDVNGDTELVVTTVTETGFAEAKRMFPFASQHLYLPFDLPSLSSQFIGKLKPDVVILSETDYWYNLLRKAKEQGAKIAVVNGKLSLKSAGNFGYIKSFAKSLFSFVDRFCCQEEVYKERLIEAGAEKDKVVVTGNLKYDFTPPYLGATDLTTFKQKLGISPNQLVLVAGSTHAGEEELMIDAWKSLRLKFPELKLILVPRHPERFPHVETILKQANVDYQTYTDPKGSATGCTLVNAMGILMNCYQASTIALVGGSFVPGIGGHNIIEPCAYQVPVIFGPYMENQPEMVQLMLRYQAGIQSSPEELGRNIEVLLESQDKRSEFGKSGAALIADQIGTVDKTLKALEGVLGLHL